jgi:hypothetical protein
LQSNDREKYWQFAKMNHELSKNITLRGMLRFKGSSSGNRGVFAAGADPTINMF